jgi:transposase
MAKPLPPDTSWEKVEPLLPRPGRRRFRYPGRKPRTPRQALTGIPFVLRTGLRWNDLPCELGCGPGSRCRRYLRAWHRAAVGDHLHALPPAELGDAGAIDWSRAAGDASLVRARGGGSKTGPGPVDRGRNGPERHAVADRRSVPPGATTTAADVPDVTAPPEAVAAAPARGERGRRKRRPKKLYGDRAYDGDPHRRRMRLRGTDPGPPAAGRRTGAGWGNAGGRSSDCSPGCTGSGGRGSGRIGTTGCTTPSSRWRSARSASASSDLIPPPTLTTCFRRPAPGASPTAN